MAVVMTHVVSFKKNMQTYNLYKIHNSRPHNFGGGVGANSSIFQNNEMERLHSRQWYTYKPTANEQQLLLG